MSTVPGKIVLNKGWTRDKHRRDTYVSSKSVVCLAQRHGTQQNYELERTACSRRSVNIQGMTSLMCGIGMAWNVQGGISLAADEIPPEPPIGDCTDCMGEVNGTLNACPLDSESCISTLNDDELHFAAPWSYDESFNDAVDRLVSIATGGYYDPGFEAGGISKLDASAYVVKGVLRVLANQPGNPEQPKRRIKKEFVPFDGVLQERRSVEGGGEYVRVTFGLPNLETVKDGETEGAIDPTEVIDAEFLFLPNDNIVNVRASSRVDTKESSGRLALSFTRGVVIDKNVARRKMDDLRTALRWELVPILADFDPQFNPEAPTWFEKVFKPFDERSKFQPSGRSYPVD